MKLISRWSNSKLSGCASRAAGCRAGAQFSFRSVSQSLPFIWNLNDIDWRAHWSELKGSYDQVWWNSPECDKSFLSEIKEMLRNIKSNSCLRGGCSGWVGNCRIGGKAAVLQVPRRWQRPSLQLGWFTSKARCSHQCWRSHNTSTRFTWTSSTQADSHLAPTALDESLPWRDVPSSPPRVTRWLLVVVTTAGTILVQHQLVEERRQSASEWRLEEEEEEEEEEAGPPPPSCQSLRTEAAPLPGLDLNNSHMDLQL